MKSRIIFLIIFIFTFTLTGCSVNLKSSKNQPVMTDAGVYKTANKGDLWKQAVLIPTVSGQPAHFATVSVNSMVLDPNDPNAVYFGSAGSGLLYSYDGAATWRQAATLAGTIADVAVDPKDKCTVYAAIGNRLWQSTDCNRSWTQVYYDSDPSVGVASIAIDFTDSRNVFIGTTRGEIIKSADTGKSWTTIERFSSQVIRIMIDPADAKVMFAAIKSKGLFRSTDAGLTWTDLSDKLKEFKDARNYKDMAMTMAQSGLIYMATTYGLLKSDDRGDKWEKIELIPPDLKATINAFAVSPKDPKEIYYVTNTAFYKSIDGGATWTPKKLPTTKAGWKLLINPENPSIIYLGIRVLQQK